MARMYDRIVGSISIRIEDKTHRLGTITTEISFNSDLADELKISPEHQPQGIVDVPKDIVEDVTLSDGRQATLITTFTR